MPSVTLSDRAYIAISGEDAEGFLQGLVTADLAAVETGTAAPCALLTPQGKILFEFLVSRTDNGFLVEVADSSGEALAKRLAMYKLRAKVIVTRLAEHEVTVVWEQDQPENSLVDTRFSRAGLAVFRLPGGSGVDAPALYTDLRIQHGIAEAGVDFPLQDAFPHDALYDVNGGVSFRKGCFVGQEVVSRMQHRATARRRIVILEGETDLPPAGSPLMAGGREIGQTGSVSGKQGLAMARIDRIAESIDRRIPIMVGNVPVTARLPSWSGLHFPDIEVTGDADEVAP